MSDKKRPRLGQPINEICPYLGLNGDQATYSGYPSQLNACYHSKPVSSPNLMHQREFCLGENHVNCFLYQVKNVTKMPKKIQYQSGGLSFHKKTTFWIFGLCLTVLLIAAAVIFRGYWLPTISGEPLPDPTPDHQSAVITDIIPSEPEKIEMTPSLTPVEQVHNTSTPTAAVPSPTATLAPTNPPLALETPIGSADQFVIHRIVEGESLLLYANWYRTSTEAIQAVNLGFSYPIKTGELLIIPVGITDTTNMPQFEPYENLVEGISVQDLANQLNVSAADLCYYNNIDQNQYLHLGDWLIVPREQGLT